MAVAPPKVTPQQAIRSATLDLLIQQKNDHIANGKLVTPERGSLQPPSVREQCGHQIGEELRR